MSLADLVKARVLGGSDMDYVGLCPASALDGEPVGRRPIDLLPGAKSIIVFGRRLISGTIQAKFRYLEEGKMTANSSYSAHSSVLSVNHLCMKETYDIAQYLEKTFGCFAMPLTNNVLQAVQPEGNYLPFFADPYGAGLPVDIYKAAVACGIGEMGWNHRVITPDNGPRVYLCAIVTTMEFEEYDRPYAGPKLCDPTKCRRCAEVCPTCALSAEKSEKWSAGDSETEVGALNVNGCAVACFGFTRKTNRMSAAAVESDSPTDAELAAALERQFQYPGMQTLEHLPMFHCDKCLLYCPVGNWNDRFVETGLTRNGGSK